MRINWGLPLRTIKKHKRVYAVGYYGGAFDARHVGPDPQWGSGGVVYTGDGYPLEDNPWGPIENFDESAELFVGWTEVASPAEVREQREAREQIAQSLDAFADDPLFGSF